MAGVFAMTGLRLWFVTHYDAQMGNKVKGLGLDVAKIKKALREGTVQTSNESRPNDILPTDMANMSLDSFVETLGFDAKELNNPIVRPIAEKIFNQIKDKAAGGADADGTRTETGY